MSIRHLPYGAFRPALVVGRHKADVDFYAGELPNAVLFGVTVEIFTGQPKIGRAHVCTPVTNQHLVCGLLLQKNISILNYTSVSSHPLQTITYNTTTNILQS